MVQVTVDHIFFSFLVLDWRYDNMFGIGMPEILVIMLLVLILFGSKRLPEIARGLGKGMQEFKKAADDVKRELDINKFDDDLQG